MRTRYTRRPALAASGIITPEEVLAVGYEILREDGEPLDLDFIEGGELAIPPVEPERDPALERLLALARQPLEDEPDEPPPAMTTALALDAVTRAHDETLYTIRGLAGR